jgi:hypothetical protein
MTGTPRAGPGFLGSRSVAHRTRGGTAAQSHNGAADLLNREHPQAHPQRMRKSRQGGATIVAVIGSGSPIMHETLIPSSRRPAHSVPRAGPGPPVDLPDCGGEHGHRDSALGRGGRGAASAAGWSPPSGCKGRARAWPRPCRGTLCRQARAGLAGTLVDGADQGDAEGLHAVWLSTTRSPRTVAPWIASQ